MSAPAVRIGGVPYGVGARLVTGLDDRADCELYREPPRRLIAMLRSGDLDAGLVSSIEAFRSPGYRVCPGLGIASRGPVHSVRAFIRKRAVRDGATPRRIGVDSGSETSVALLQILLAEGLAGLPPLAPPACPELERIEPTRDPAALPHDLILLIGDAGLAARSDQHDAIDLGEAWHGRTGLPFVFALWLLAPAADAERIVPMLHRAYSLARASAAGDDAGGSVHHELGAADLHGLERFRRDAVALGLADPDIRPTPIPTPTIPPHR